MLRKLDCRIRKCVCFPIIKVFPFTSRNSETSRIQIPSGNARDLLSYRRAKPLAAFFPSYVATSICSAIHLSRSPRSNCSYLSVFVYFHLRENCNSNLLLYFFSQDSFIQCRGRVQKPSLTFSRFNLEIFVVHPHIVFAQKPFSIPF